MAEEMKHGSSRKWALAPKAVIYSLQAIAIFAIAWALLTGTRQSSSWKLEDETEYDETVSAPLRPFRYRSVYPSEANGPMLIRNGLFALTFAGISA